MLKELIRNAPVIGPITMRLYRMVRSIGRKSARAEAFTTSGHYWEHRYDAGGYSGEGSYGKFADFKAGVINAFLKDQAVTSVIEFGCGDGNQLKLLRLPQYLGLDVSDTAIRMNRRAFARHDSKRFRLMSEYRGEQADLALSLDVIYHLVEDDVFQRYMQALFASAKRFVIIFSTNFDNADTGAAHVRHRKFTDWVRQNASGWTLMQHIPSAFPEVSLDFFIYARQGS